MQPLDFFRSRIDAMINLNDPLAVLATRLPWEQIEASVAAKFERQDRAGQVLEGRDMFGTTKVLVGATDQYMHYGIPKSAKPVVGFLRDARSPKIQLPLAADSASVLYLLGREAFTADFPSDKGPVSMKPIERAFGSNVTTRTWETVVKCAAA